MRLHRFFVPHEIEGKEIVIKDSALLNQLKNVFRFTVGGQVILLDNTGYEYHALISSFGYGEVTFQIVSRKISKNIPERELHLFCALPKKDKFEWILEKGTEIGVKEFHPLISDRCEKKDFNHERAEKIVREASEQSGRALIPTIAQTLTFEQSLKQDFPCIALHLEGDQFIIEAFQNNKMLGVFVGPEGGWTERELFLFRKNKIKIYSLGNGVLRSETAAISAGALLLLQ